MAKLNVASISSDIIRNCSVFGGHDIYPGCANIQIFRELLNMDRYFQQEAAAVSCNYDAKSKKGKDLTVTITKEDVGTPEAGGWYSIRYLKK